MAGLPHWHLPKGLAFQLVPDQPILETMATMRMAVYTEAVHDAVEALARAVRLLTQRDTFRPWHRYDPAA